ncbi:MAG: hypothetical protein A2035_08595 [Nitrospirae bacterium GWA2_42_11]|nr:MAG: hypothetical protein A2035_08595 [Nitrospirae bacterium GWA2_42_11]
MNKKLCIMLSTAPDNKNLDTALGIIYAAIKSNISVYLYLVDEGAACINDNRVIELSKIGLRLYVCAYGAQKKRIEPSDIASFGGLSNLSELIKVCDRFIPFG